MVREARARVITLMAMVALMPLTARAQETQPTEETSPEMASAELALTQPALVTTVGRADGTIVRVICDRAGLADVTLLEEVTPEDLAGVGTLVVAMGGSTKGLGAAGIDAAVELERGREVMAAAEAANLSVLGVHVGGEARRGEISDPFCELVAGSADALLVKSSGNADGFFTRMATERGILLIEVETNGAAIEAISDLFE